MEYLKALPKPRRTQLSSIDASSIRMSEKESHYDASILGTPPRLASAALLEGGKAPSDAESAKPKEKVVEKKPTLPVAGARSPRQHSTLNPISARAGENQTPSQASIGKSINDLS